MSSQDNKPEPPRVYAKTLVPLPRVAIKFCVQCKWNLRAAYYAQELLQTFSLSLGEVALIPSTSGSFLVTVSQQEPRLPSPMTPRSSSPSITGPNTTATATATASDSHQGRPAVSEANLDRADDVAAAGIREHVIWDRKVDGGFPETKELKRRLRDLVEPGRGLGHVDRDHGGVGGRKGGGGGREGKERRLGDYDGDDENGDGNGNGKEEEKAKAKAKGEGCDDCS